LKRFCFEEYLAYLLEKASVKLLGVKLEVAWKIILVSFELANTLMESQ